MHSLFYVAITLLAAASVYAQVSQFSINTPSNVVVCQPSLIQWQGGSAPYYLSVLPGNDPTGTALENLGTFNGTSFSWKVNIAAGTSIDLTLRDSNGNLAQTASFTVNPGSDTSCVGQAGSGSTGTTTATPLPATSGTTGGSTGTSEGSTGTRTSNVGTSGSSTGTQTSDAGTKPSSTSSGSSASPISSSGASHYTFSVDDGAPTGSSQSISTTTAPSSIASTSSSAPAPQSSSSKTGIIVGSTFGGLAVIALVLVFFIRRLRRAPPVQYKKDEGMLDIDVPTTHHQPNHNRGIPVPVHALAQSKAVRERQRQIDERIQSAQCELDNLRNAGFADEIGNPSPAGPSQPSPELASLQNAVQQLRDRIEYLHTQRESDLALVHPPAYTNNV